MTKKPEGAYRIVRFYRDGPNEARESGLTLAQAQKHCQREDTHGDGWFDGYEVEDPSDEELQERAESDARLRAGILAVEGLTASLAGPVTM
jgi:hypothetical protein